MHYALVADLIPREEFDERVWKKCEELGSIIDETTAAMLVVEEMGRAHIRIADIAHSRTDIVCFFGKVLEKSEPRIFDRKNGEEGEKGVVANLVLGDPTGTVRLTLWDALAASVEELQIGQVLEVIAKPRPGGNAVCCALRESNVEIVDTKRPPKQDILENPLDVKILAVFPRREIIRRNGNPAELQEFIVGDESGTVKLTTWRPEIFDGIKEGDCVSITGVKRKEEDGVVGYSVFDTAEVEFLGHDIEVLTATPGEVEEGHTSVVCGTVTNVSDMRRFVSRNGKDMCVRNIKISGNDGKSVSVALWGQNAEDLYTAGEVISVINADAKLNRFGDMELSVGYSAVVRGSDSVPEAVTLQGMIIPRPEGLTLDDGNKVWLLSGAEGIPCGTAAEVKGVAARGRVEVAEVTVLHPDA